MYLAAAPVSRPQGFALLELMVALGLLSVIALLALPSVLHRLDDDRERSVARILCSYASLAQLTAVESGVATTVDVGDRRVPGVEAGAGPISAASGLTADAVSANQPAWYVDGGVSIHFVPPFGAPYGGGTITIGDRRAVVVRVVTGLTFSRAY